MQPFYHVLRMASEEPRPCAAQTVLRQHADHFEERGPYFIVEIFRWQLLLIVLAQTDPHFCREVGFTYRTNGLSEHASLLSTSYQVIRLRRKRPHQKARRSRSDCGSVI